jgi:hypothetical protein
MRWLAVAIQPRGGSISRGVFRPVEKTGPVVARFPSRRRRHAAQVVIGTTQRNAAGGNEADAAGGIGHHHVLHRRTYFSAALMNSATDPAMLMPRPASMLP